MEPHELRSHLGTTWDTAHGRYGSMQANKQKKALLPSVRAAEGKNLPVLNRAGALDLCQAQHLMIGLQAIWGQSSLRYMIMCAGMKLLSC